MAAFLQFEGSKQDDATEQIKRLYALFLKLDATQIEINPFGETPDGEGTSHIVLFFINCYIKYYFTSSSIVKLFLFHTPICFHFRLN